MASIRFIEFVIRFWSDAPIGRTEFSLYLTLYFFLQFLIVYTSSEVAAFFIVSSFFLFIIFLWACIKRLNDLKLSPWFFLLVFAPAVNIGLLGFLVLKKGGKE